MLCSGRCRQRKSCLRLWASRYTLWIEGRAWMSIHLCFAKRHPPTIRWDGHVTTQTPAAGIRFIFLDNLAVRNAVWIRNRCARPRSFPAGGGLAMEGTKISPVAIEPYFGNKKVCQMWIGFLIRLGTRTLRAWVAIILERKITNVTLSELHNNTTGRGDGLTFMMDAAPGVSALPEGFSRKGKRLSRRNSFPEGTAFPEGTGFPRFGKRLSGWHQLSRNGTAFPDGTGFPVRLEQLSPLMETAFPDGNGSIPTGRERVSLWKDHLCLRRDL